MIEAFVIIPLSYLLGSILFGPLIIRIAGLGDLRKIGPGTVGATNVLRTGKKGLAALTLMLDCGKGAVAVLLAEAICQGSGPMAGLFAFLGHIFPVWLKFKGGKGIATALGVILVLAWPVGLTAIAIWLIMAISFRYSSLAALVATGLVPAAAYIFGYYDLLWLTVLIVILIFIRHSSNIKRLMNGIETRIELKKK